MLVIGWALGPACLDAPPAASSAALAQLITTWDPLACGDPHRVAVELVDDAGQTSSASAPCELGVVAVGVDHFGGYHGRVYAWAVGALARSTMAIQVEIMEAVVRQHVVTPP
ncbi:MAG TPA: hypothetical protein VGC42_20695 [Kofleriaceae bacterium]